MKNLSTQALAMWLWREGTSRRQFPLCVLWDFCKKILSPRQNFFAATRRTNLNWFKFLRTIAWSDKIKVAFVASCVLHIRHVTASKSKWNNYTASEKSVLIPLQPRSRLNVYKISLCAPSKRPVAATCFWINTHEATCPRVASQRTNA